jgi:hypothetical protein
MSDFETAFLKKAVLRGVGLKNHRGKSKTNRVLELAQRA